MSDTSGPWVPGDHVQHNPSSHVHVFCVQFLCYITDREHNSVRARAMRGTRDMLMCPIHVEIRGYTAHTAVVDHHAD